MKLDTRTIHGIFLLLQFVSKHETEMSRMNTDSTVCSVLKHEPTDTGLQGWSGGVICPDWPSRDSVRELYSQFDLGFENSPFLNQDF